MSSRLSAILLLAVSFLFPLSPARALDPFLRHASISGVPVEVLRTIARAESGMRPFAIGLKLPLDRKHLLKGLKFKGRMRFSSRKKALLVSLYPETAADAVRIVRFLVKRGIRNFDVGLMQINYGNIRRWGLDPVLFLDPELNLMAGALIYRDCLRRYGSPEAALRCYRGKTTSL